MQSKCPVCGTHMSTSFSLGSLYVSDFIDADEVSEGRPKSDLTMLVCPNCDAGKLAESINPDLMYKEMDYWYYSGVNETMKAALMDVVNCAYESIPTEPFDVWLDIACNDGTLLDYVPTEFVTVGIDPSTTTEKVSKEHLLVNDYFSKKAFRKVVPNGQAKIITCIAMFYDLANPHPFLEDVREILSDDGLFVVQISYTPLMFHQREFGNVCAEHVMYYNLHSLKTLFEQHGLYIQDVDLNDINGGSFRVYATKSDNSHFRTPQKRDVAQFRMDSLLLHEACTIITDKFQEFGKQIDDLKWHTVDFIKRARAEGKTVWAYGASTKGNTLLQYFGLDNTLIDCVVERNPIKFGKKTIGTEIPIVSEQEFRDNPPDYALVLPWHFIEEFVEREEDFLIGGGHFIVPCPEFEVI